MSCCNSEKLKKKPKKLKPRTSIKKTRNTQSQARKTTLTIRSQEDVEPEPPLTIVDSIDSRILKWNQEEPRDCDPYKDGDYSKIPHEAPNEVNFVGGIGGNKGHKRSKKFIDRTTKIQQIFNMRNDNRTVFNFCEDPRLTSNVPPKGKVIKSHSDDLVKDTVLRIGAIKHEQLPMEKASDPSTDIKQDVNQKADLSCDFNENDLVVQTHKQKNLEIRKQYLDQKRMLLKQQMETEVEQQLGGEYRKKKFQLSEYFDIDKKIPEDVDDDSVEEVIADWTEKYKVEPHSCDLKFARPMPEVIPMPLQINKLAELTRTLDKPKNIEKLDQERRKYAKPIEEKVTKDFPHRESARELKKIIEKQRVENLSIELALKDFDEFMQNSSAFNIEISSENENIETSDDRRRENLKAAIKDYEEKILQHLSDFDATSSTLTTDENSEIMENSEDDSKCSSSQDITLPIDFTYAFDTRQPKTKYAEPKNKRIKEGVNSKIIIFLLIK